MSMQTLQVVGLAASKTQIPKQFFLGQDLSYHMLAAPFTGRANYNLKLLLVRLRQSILLYLWQ